MHCSGEKFLFLLSLQNIFLKTKILLGALSPMATGLFSSYAIYGDLYLWHGPL